MKGSFSTSSLLVKKCDFLKKHTRTLSVNKSMIYNNKYFLEVPPFTNLSFSINSNTLYHISKHTFEYEINHGKLVSSISLGTMEIKETINVDEAETYNLDVDDPLVSFECPHDLLKLILKMDRNDILYISIRDTTVECTVKEAISYKFVFKNVKIQVNSENTVNAKIRTSDILFLNDLLDNSIIFCIFEDFLLLYCYDQEATLAVRIEMLS